MTVWVGFDGTLLDEDGDGPAAAGGNPFATVGSEELAGCYVSGDGSGAMLMGQARGDVHHYAPLSAVGLSNLVASLSDAGWACTFTSDSGLAANCISPDGQSKFRFVTDPDMLRVQLLASPHPVADWAAMDQLLSNGSSGGVRASGYFVGADDSSSDGTDLSSLMSQFGSALGQTPQQQQGGLGQQFGQIGGALGGAAGGGTGQQVGQSVGDILGQTMQGAQKGGWQGALASGLAAVVKDAVVPAIAAASKGGQKPPSASQAMAQLAAPATAPAPAPASAPTPVPPTPAVTYTPAASPSSVASARTVLMQTLDGLARKYGMPPASLSGSGGAPTLSQVASFAQSVAPS